MPLKFELKNKSYDLGQSVVEKDNTYILNYPCGNNCSHCSPYTTRLPRGSYILEVWGGQGGLGGGKGGYSKGILRLSDATTVYIYIGSKGCELSNKNGITPLAFGGGGSGSSAHSDTAGRSAGSGGGASDIRIHEDDLNNRIIVAGGGGGNSYANEDIRAEGGFGGGENGQDIALRFEDNFYQSKGGTQECAPAVGEETFQGDFGNGGSSQSNHYTMSGGGGGWFGGSSGPQGSLTGGGGGSGYVLHESSFKSFNYQLNNSKYFLQYWELKSGNETFKGCDGTYFPSSKTEFGHSGSGCARITILTDLLCFYHTCQIKQRCFHFYFINFIILQSH